jgi:hypothetical protein
VPKGIGEAIKAELESLGIKLTSTLASKIPNSTEEIVLTAIEALKEELQHQVIKSPGGWLSLYSVMRDEWQPNQALREKHPVDVFGFFYKYKYWQTLPLRCK